MISIDPVKDEIRPVVNDRFKDAQGKPIKRYEVLSNSYQQWQATNLVSIQDSGDAVASTAKEKLHHNESCEIWNR